jgi:hypothetical protein
MSHTPTPAVRTPRHRADFRPRRSARRRWASRAARYLVGKALGAVTSRVLSFVLGQAAAALDL